jgi:hypothetical protein
MSDDFGQLTKQTQVRPFVEQIVHILQKLGAGFGV